MAGAVAGDVTDAGSVAAVAAGHDVAVSAVYTADVDPAAVRRRHPALLDGLARAGVGRLLVVGLATTLEGPDGKRVFEGEDFPDAYRPFSLGRAAELAELERGPVDWVLFTPTMQLVDEPGTASYAITGDGRLVDGTTTYADLAAAMLDEAVSPGAPPRPAHRPESDRFLVRAERPRRQPHHGRGEGEQPAAGGHAGPVGCAGQRRRPASSAQLTGLPAATCRIQPGIRRLAP